MKLFQKDFNFIYLSFIKIKKNEETITYSCNL